MGLFGKSESDPAMDAEPMTLNRSDGVGTARATASKGMTVVAAGSTITGSIASSGTVDVNGTVTGDIEADTITVGQNGVVTGNILSETATVRGAVTGNVTARTIQLAGTGKIEGDLTHAILVIEQGGYFEGQSKRMADPLEGKTALNAPAAKLEAPSNDRSSLADQLEDGFAKN